MTYEELANELHNCGQAFHILSIAQLELEYSGYEDGMFFIMAALAERCERVSSAASDMIEGKQ